ncbi:MAG: hypothetical protein WBW48_22620 [Anaerolineae bacterium]
MAWMLSPSGIGVIAALIVVLALLIYWKREPIKKWFASRKVSLKIKAGPVEVGLDEKEKPKKATGVPAGVDFGEGGDFTGATIRGVAGRDIRRGSAAAESPGGKAPGVDFGKKGKFGDAEIEDVAGRDIVED